MICPECGSEYRDGYSQCADCEVPLVEPEPEEEGDAEMEIVKVFTATNAAILPLVESVLLDANIQFMTKSDNLQDLFALGRLGMGSNNTIGPATVWVRKDDEAEALELIETLDELEEEPLSGDDE